jgi:hypothetical protein
MSRDQAELLLNLSVADSLKACARGAGALGWRLTNTHAAGMTCVQQAPTPMAIGNPVTVEVCVRDAHEHATSLTLKGRNFGFGPFQRRYVRQRLEDFRLAIEQAGTGLASPPPAVGGTRAVLINGVRLSDYQVDALEHRNGARIPDGAYWYDRLCGAWGVQGGPTLGFIQAGLELGGALRADASHGDTGVFINGRELHRLDVQGLQQLGPVWPGRYWVDAQGDVGFEGGLMLGNLWVLAQQRLAGGSQGGGPWAVYAGGGVAAGDGQGGYFAQFGEFTWSNG